MLLLHPGALRALIADRDIYASARLVILQHAERATIHAAMRADALLDAGDLDGQRVWPRIVKAIEELQSTSKPAAAAVL